MHSHPGQVTLPSTSSSDGLHTSGLVLVELSAPPPEIQAWNHILLDVPSELRLAEDPRMRLRARRPVEVGPA
ncbi:hypothetical protein CERZMDRAFT_94898 [Cercospora zeae-maydis SCOH1-5]|uniref:Uncharacterized protein n=1 Tax=Cercospora zeae-maydis SCOH1-5 TaxID=717836 RepID=A0A6A6FPY9_9PEZI|nr:hypothetical protein CERZMDRAFT_94898 [Cercospora zeae-maydis SCOH1-5]